MAETKTKTTETKTKAPAVQKEQTVRIMLPIGKGMTDDVYVSVNDRSWLIKRGIEVEVPLCVAEVLKNKADMELAALKFKEGVKS